MKKLLHFMILFVAIIAVCAGCSTHKNTNDIEESQFVDEANEKDLTKPVLNYSEYLKSEGTIDNYGNSNGNIINGGLACIKDEWIYFSTAEGLFRMKNDGSEQEKINLCEDIENNNIYIINLNIFDDYIYFRNFVKGFVTEYVVKSDGSNLRKVDLKGDLYINDGNYYTWDNPLMTEYSDSLEMSTEHYLSSVSSGYTINVCEYWIYYCGADNNGNYAIQRMSVDGSVKETLLEGRTNYMVVDGEYIYYQGYHDYYIYRMKVDGTEHGLIFENPIIWQFNVANGWIYYTDREEKVLCKVRVNGTDCQKVTSDWAKDINVVGDWIFYLKNSTDEEPPYDIDVYCRVKTDGSCYEQLGEISDRHAYTRYYSDDESQFAISGTTYEDYDFDFNDFAGIYAPAADYSNEAEVTNITMASDGTVTGSVTAYGFVTQWAGKRPYMMEKNSDGSITFRVQDTPEFSEFYILYPEGVKDRNDMFDSDRVRIEYIISEGGIIGYTYYKDDSATENVDGTPDVNYNGIDWVSQDAFTSEIGKCFVSGTGIEYEVIDEEQNNNSSRTRIVLKSETGQKCMIDNLPAFELDIETGIIYYNIFKYSSSAEYTSALDSTVSKQNINSNNSSQSTAPKTENTNSNESTDNKQNSESQYAYEDGSENPGLEVDILPDFWEDLNDPENEIVGSIGNTDSDNQDEESQYDYEDGSENPGLNVDEGFGGESFWDIINDPENEKVGN